MDTSDRRFTPWQQPKRVLMRGRAREVPGGEPLQVSPEERDLEDLIDALAREIDGAALLSALIASCLNRSAAQYDVVDLSRLLTHMPARPILAPAFGDLTAEHSHMRALASAVASFVGELAVAKHEMRKAAAAHDLIGPAEVALHARQWRHVCGSARDVCDMLVLTSPETACDPTGLDRKRLAQMLTNARSGGWRFVGQEGDALPDWAQRRRHRRVLLNMTARLETTSAIRDVLVRDAAPGGFGIDFAEGLREREPVTLTLIDGRRFDGHVAWIRASRAGVTLDVPLPTNDVLFQWEW